MLLFIAKLHSFKIGINIKGVFYLEFIYRLLAELAKQFDMHIAFLQVWSHGFHQIPKGADDF